MNIPNNLFIFIDIIVGLIFLFNIIKSYRNGFIYELLNLGFLLLSIVFAWFIAPVLSTKVSIVNIKNPIEGVLDITSLNIMLNTIIWIVIIVIVLNLLFMLIKPIFKSLSKIPVLGFFNKILGVLIGLINAYLVCLLLATLLTLPIINNGSEVKNGTVFKYSEKVSAEVTKFIVNNVDLSKIENEIGDFDVQGTRDSVLNWLVSQGILNE